MLKKGLINLGILPILLFNDFTLIPLKNQPLTFVESYKSDTGTLFEKGKQYYQQGQYSQAADILQQSILGFSQQGDIVNQAIALSNLSLVLQQLGQGEPAEKVLQESLALIQNLSFAKKPLILAQMLEIQGQLELNKGQPEQAIKTWKAAFTLYSEAGNWLGKVTTQINQSTALQTLGLYRQSLKTLTEVNETLKSQPDSLMKATALLSLGNTLIKVGDLKTAQTVLQKSLELAKAGNYSQILSQIYLSLANLNRTQNNSDIALENYQNAVKTASNSLERLQALINQYNLLIHLDKKQESDTLSQDIQAFFSQVPASRRLIYAMVNFTNSLMKLDSNTHQSQIINLLNIAIESSKNLKDWRSESYALGSLGKFYEKNNQVLEAQKLTEQALLIAQSINASDIAYQWQWQLGRLLKKQNQKNQAIAAYTEAVNTLKSLKKDLVAINQDVQFSFRESVEPVYRELVDLILQSPTPDHLQKARELIESLQLAELDNFFREACLDQEIKPQQIDQIDPNAAVIYPIILTNRLEVILSLPGQPLRQYSTPISQEQVDTTIRQLRLSFQPIFSTKERLELSQNVYNWLIRPAEFDLTNSSIKTLVFVLDGSLRNVPMAALYDGKNYLIQNYNIALTPGLKLLASQSLKRNKLKALTVGLSEARQGFSALPAVASEIEKIEAKIPTKVLLNQQFTRDAVQEQIQKTAFPIVHLATHGQFSSNAEDTFLLTWDSRINVKDLDDFLRNRQQGIENPVELLVLSACETATGDQRAALGLAGVAVRSGARSTLATLWQVNDTSTASLMAEFYQELTQQQVSKAEALRQAQLKLLQQPKYQDPYYWAPFVLVGNWQ
jgi:CHAT domain-containing protein